MSCVVLVLQNPYFAVTSERGVYTIRDVPPGTYKLKAWHERLPCQVQEVVVPSKPISHWESKTCRLPELWRNCAHP
jgi:hypothetical protein